MNWVTVGVSGNEEGAENTRKKPTQFCVLIQAVHSTAKFSSFMTTTGSSQKMIRITYGQADLLSEVPRTVQVM